MANINLLPWREELREERNKNFYVVIGIVVAITLAAIFAVYSYYDSAQSSQRLRNSYLQNEIAALDKKILEIRELKETRSELIERMELIQALQGNRPVIVRLFDEVVRAVPDDLHLTSLVTSGNSVKISGVASSNNRVSALMRNFDDSEWFRDPVLMSVEAKSQGVNEFEMTVTRVTPKAEEGPGNG